MKEHTPITEEELAEIEAKWRCADGLIFTGFQLGETHWVGCGKSQSRKDTENLRDWLNQMPTEVPRLIAEMRRLRRVIESDLEPATGAGEGECPTHTWTSDDIGGPVFTPPTSQGT